MSDLYEDPYFIPKDRSVYAGVEDGDPFPQLNWKRPNEFFKTQGAVFEDIEPNDIKQGQLGDCWFMCALAALAERPALVHRLFKSTEINEQGKYIVCFCKNGEWVDVTVDDKFPCGRRGPLFSRSNGDELWVLLLEKAYAKLHGSYMLLRDGWPVEGMIDLTGCPTTSLTFEDEDTQEMIASGKLWEDLMRFDNQGALISSATPGVDEWTEKGGPDKKGGLVPGHAYTVIAIKEACGNKLVQIRNPWGQFEWDGDWSDNSSKWTEEVKAIINPVLDDEDGTFWMSYEDFLKHYTNVNICRVSGYYEARVKGIFTRHEDHVLSKWFYFLEVPSATKAFLGVHQEDNRILGAKQQRAYLDVGIVVLKSGSGGNWTIYAVKDGCLDRQAEIELDLEPGSYVIVPRTSGCPMAYDTKTTGSGVKLVDGEHNIPTPMFISTLKDLFRKYDLRVSQGLSHIEFGAMLKDIDQPEISKDEFLQYAHRFGREDDELDKEAFVGWVLDQTKKNDEETMYQWLEKWGYDRNLYSFRERVFVLTVHSEQDNLSMNMRNMLESGLGQKVNDMLLESRGTEKTQSAVKLMLFNEPESGGYNYGGYNNTDKEKLVTFDCSKSQGMLFSTKNPVAKVNIPPHEYRMFYTAMCDPRAEEFGLKPSFKFQ